VYQHHIAREDGGIEAVAAVHRGHAAPHRGFIHDVVVHEAEVVEQLHGHGRRQCRLRVIGKLVVAHHGEHGAEALAAKAEEVVDGLVQGGRRLLKFLLLQVVFEE